MRWNRCCCCKWFCVVSRNFPKRWKNVERDEGKGWCSVHEIYVIWYVIELCLCTHKNIRVRIYSMNLLFLFDEKKRLFGVPAHPFCCAFSSHKKWIRKRKLFSLISRINGNLYPAKLNPIMFYVPKKHTLFQYDDKEVWWGNCSWSELISLQSWYFHVVVFCLNWVSALQFHII